MNRREAKSHKAMVQQRNEAVKQLEPLQSQLNAAQSAHARIRADLEAGFAKELAHAEALQAGTAGELATAQQQLSEAREQLEGAKKQIAELAIQVGNLEPAKVLARRLAAKAEEVRKLDGERHQLLALVDLTQKSLAAAEAVLGLVPPDLLRSFTAERPSQLGYAPPLHRRATSR